jgi:hypothetical protein
MASRMKETKKIKRFMPCCSIGVETPVVFRCRLSFWDAYIQTLCMKELSVGFAAAHETAAATLTDNVLWKLHSLIIRTNDCRGKQHWHEFRCEGENITQQSKSFLSAVDVNNWNLLLCVVVKHGSIQRIYTLLSRSSKRWTILNN